LNPYSQNPGILDWYTVLVGLMAFTTLTMHGANFIAVKTENTVNARARRVARLAWIATIVLAIPSTIATFSVQPHIEASFLNRPWGFIFPIIALIGLIGMGYATFRQQDLVAFYSSGAFIIGMLSS